MALQGRADDDKEKVGSWKRCSFFLVLLLTFSRYSEFDDLRNKLLITFPHSEAAMPPLPPKSIVCRSITIHQFYCMRIYAFCSQVSSEVSGEAENWSGVLPQVRTCLPFNGELF